MTTYKQTALKMADSIKEETKELCRFIYQHPELGFHEFESSKAIQEMLKNHGFQVTPGVADLETAFRAEADSGKTGPVIGFLCEYDALPGINHGCGHNIIGSSSAAAAIAAWEAAKEAGGKIIVLGTPAEEGSGGGKEILLRAGLMDELDCAMMAHPGPWTSTKGSSLAIRSYRFIFHGKAAHAAATPDQGASALEAVIQMFNQVNALRAYLPADTRVNGIITKGGTAPNIVPDLCEAVFNIRSDTKKTLEALEEKVMNCANAGALSSGCTVEIRQIGIGYDEIVPNSVLIGVLESNLALMGEEIHKKEAGRPIASTDIGNVTHHIPAFQVMFRVGDGSAIPHSAEFARVCGEEGGMELAVRISKVLCGVACDLMENPELLKQAKAEQYEKTKGEKS